jgi:two-component system OmpR family response regulator
VDAAPSLAQAGALLRTARFAADAPVLALGDLQIDLAREQVRRAGVPIALTHKEWALLRVLATRPGRIHTRENLQDALYGWGDETDSNTLEVFISRLRRKLGREHIETLRGLGYRLALGGPGAA